MSDLVDEALLSLRQILRATSMESRRLARAIGFSGPQLLLLRALEDRGTLTASELARVVSLSQATITPMIAALESRGLLHRKRSDEDRRRIHITLSEAGHQALKSVPLPMQETFARRFSALPRWEQHQLVSALERIAVLAELSEGRPGHTRGSTARIDHQDQERTASS